MQNWRWKNYPALSDLKPPLLIDPGLSLFVLVCPVFVLVCASLSWFVPVCPSLFRFFKPHILISLFAWNAMGLETLCMNIEWVEQKVIFQSLKRGNCNHLNIIMQPSNCHQRASRSSARLLLQLEVLVPNYHKIHSNQKEASHRTNWCHLDFVYTLINC